MIHDAIVLMYIHILVYVCLLVEQLRKYKLKLCRVFKEKKQKKNSYWLKLAFSVEIMVFSMYLFLWNKPRVDRISSRLGGNSNYDFRGS